MELLNSRHHSVSGTPGDSSIRCATCGLLCDLITIAKGPNKGRKFYCCESEDCVLFVCWQDSIPATSGGDNGLATTASIMGANSNKGHSPIHCAVCGFLCVLRAVIAGPNQGIKFYSCEKTEDCMFFVRWEDSIPTTSGDDNSLATTTSIMGVNSNNGDSPIQCAVCGFLCVLRAVIAGPNQGRIFYSCEKTKDCMFFVCWQDSIPATSGGDNGLATTASIMGANSNKGHSPIQCAVCGFLCVLRAVIAGPNQGRKFYSCEKTEDCMFFVRWEDSIPTTSGDDNSLATTTSIMGVNSNNGDSPIQCAVCGFLCVLRAVIAGSNQGRNFYSCEKTKDCMFFVCWEDSIPTTRDGGSSSDTSTSR